MVREVLIVRPEFFWQRKIKRSLPSGKPINTFYTPKTTAPRYVPRRLFGRASSVQNDLASVECRLIATTEE
jgi:hypothetical protein